jgi:hypothetical protein
VGATGIRLPWSFCYCDIANVGNCPNTTRKTVIAQAPLRHAQFTHLPLKQSLSKPYLFFKTKRCPFIAVSPHSSSSSSSTPSLSSSSVRSMESDDGHGATGSDSIGDWVPVSPAPSRRWGSASSAPSREHVLGSASPGASRYGRVPTSPGPFPGASYGDRFPT